MIDGIVGPGTRAAIEAFQHKVGVKADRRVSPVLLRALEAAVREPVAGAAEAP